MSDIQKLLNVSRDDEDEARPDAEPQVTFEDEDLEGTIELPVEEDEKEADDEEKASLKARIAELEARTVPSTGGGEDVARGIREGLIELKEALRPAPAAQGKVMSDEEFDKWYKETYLDDPLKANIELQNRRFGRPMGDLIDRNIRLQAKMLLVDPERAETYKRFKPEIDRAIASGSPVDKYTDPDYVEKIHDRIVAGHLKELRAEGESAMERRVKELEEKLAKIGSQPARRAAPPPHSEIPRNAGLRPEAGRTVRVKAADLLSQEQKEYAQLKGLSFEKYAEILIKKGVIKNAKR